MTLEYPVESAIDYRSSEEIVEGFEVTKDVQDDIFSNMARSAATGGIGNGDKTKVSVVILLAFTVSIVSPFPLPIG
jgi:hypothetical protein